MIPTAVRVVLALTLGATAVVLPAQAASEGPPTIETEDPVHHWKPPTATIEAGGAIVFKNASSTVPHGIHWISPPATPSCEPSVPVGTEFAQSGTGWSGSCTFTTPGTYTFWCTVHGPSMSGTITVTGHVGEEPYKEPPPTTTGTTTGAGPAPSPPGSPTPGGSTGSGSPQAAAAASAAALAALRLSAPRHGAVLHGSLTVPAADAGGRLEIDLFATPAALAAAGVRVAQLVRRPLAAGRLGFSLAPNARAVHALKRHGRLAVTVTIRLSPASGSGGTVSRRLTLHR
jgi:plastocyanin